MVLNVRAPERDGKMRQIPSKRAIERRGRADEPSLIEALRQAVGLAPE
jgi:hypothetical protein